MTLSLNGSNLKIHKSHDTENENSEEDQDEVLVQNSRKSKKTTVKSNRVTRSQKKVP